MIHIIGDIHGCFKELKELINKLNITKDDELVFLGDYIDRGPDSNKVIEYLIDLKDLCKCIFLMGNHEDMLLSYIKNPHFSNASIYLNPVNGGVQTINSYGGIDQIPESHLTFLKDLKLFYETDEFFFVHAAVPNKLIKQIKKAPKVYKEYFLWERENFLNSTFNWEKKIIHGHTPIKTGKPEIKDNRINIDTACVFGGYLTAITLPSYNITQVKCKNDYFSNKLKKDYNYAIEQEKNGKEW